MQTTIENNLSQLHQQIATITQQYGRPVDAVKLLAVSKGQSIEKIQTAYAAGQHAFGENYVQEAVTKMQALADLAIEWHYIGHIQSNKTAQIASHFAWVHTVCSIPIAQRLHKQHPATLPPLNVCIQVNVSGEASKDGIAPANVLDYAQAISALPRLRLRGLMTIPSLTHDEALQRQQFHILRLAYEALQQAGIPVDTLSMGMSADFAAAIAEGATLLRIGTGIFGSRS